MEIDYFAIALKQTLFLLRQSESSFYGSLPVEEVIRQIEEELSKRKKSQPVDMRRVEFLFAPTGAIQEIAIDNGWSDEFLEISKVIP